MSIPDSYLGPPSQPWGRWVTSTLRNYLAKRQQYDTDVYNAIKQLNVATFQPMRGMLWNQTGTTVAIATAGVYVPLDLAGTLDTDGTFNMVAGTVNPSGLKNSTNQARTLVFIATYDGKAGNNNAIGLKLALNGVPIDATECRSFAGGGGQVGKALTQWTQRVEPGDEVSMWVSGIDGTTDLTVERYKLLAHAIL
jgi:hypothetical protein